MPVYVHFWAACMILMQMLKHHHDSINFPWFSKQLACCCCCMWASSALSQISALRTRAQDCITHGKAHHASRAVGKNDESWPPCWSRGSSPAHWTVQRATCRPPDISYTRRTQLRFQSVPVCRRLESTGAIEMAKREPPVIHCNTGDWLAPVWSHSCLVKC